MTNGRFVIAGFGHAPICEVLARVFHKHDLLHFVAMGTRRGVSGVPAEFTRLKPAIGLAAYVAARTLSQFRAESFRFRLHPWYDRWVKRQLSPGDHIYSSYGYANECFKKARHEGGKTILEGFNSHPEHFWTILRDEYQRWGSPHPPVAEHHYRRSLAMMEEVDFVHSPSSFVTNSFLTRGFKAGQIIQCLQPIDLSCFTPPTVPRPASRPLTVISTGTLTLRKGTPYMLEAFRLVHKKVPSARFLLTSIMFESMKPILAKYGDLPIDWAPPLPHRELANRLRSADIFVLPSLEDGLAFTVLEALACGLPAITTPNTGASDLIESGVNGEVVPIRDPQAIADAILKWADRIISAGWQARALIRTEDASFENFEREFLRQLAERKLITGTRVLFE